MTTVHTRQLITIHTRHLKIQRWMPTFRKRMFSVFRVEKLGVSLTRKRERFTNFLWNVDIRIENCILIALRETCRNESIVVTTN